MFSLRLLASVTYVLLQLRAVNILYHSCQSPATLEVLKRHRFLRSPHLGFVVTNASLMQDRSDWNWTVLLFWLSFIPHMVLYLIFTVLINTLLSKRFPMLSSCTRMVFSGLLIAYLSGPTALLNALLLTTFFLLLGCTLSEYRLVIATVLGLFMFFLDDALTFLFDHDSISSSPVMLSIVKSAYLLCLLRAGSVALTLCSKNCRQNIDLLLQATSNSPLEAPFKNSTFQLLIDSLEYSLFPYTFYFGPLITYEDWLTYRSGKLTTQCVSHAKLTGRLRCLTLSSLIIRIGRFIFWFHFWSLSLCFIYPMALFRYGTWGRFFHSDFQSNPWNTVGGLQLSVYTVFTAVHAVGIHYYFFHLFLYGIPGLLADIEHWLSRRNIFVPLRTNEKCPFSVKEPALQKANENVPSADLCLVAAPPSCVLHIALFSEMWRTFDRGLYGFMKCHIYEPLLDWSATSTTTCWKSLRQGLALTVPFFFVLFYHTMRPENVVWSAINLFSFSLELSFKWLLRNTSLRSKLLLRFPPCIIELMGNACRVFMWFFSLCGFVFFLFGIYTGLSFSTHVMLSPHVLLNFLLYVCGMYFISTVRAFCGYRGFPIGFNSANTLTSAN